MKTIFMIMLILHVALQIDAQFGSQNIISTSADKARWVFAIDLDGDSNIDVLSASSADNSIRWYKNLGNGMFGSGQIIANDAMGAFCVHAVDLDGDLDADVLSASNADFTIAWYENLGNGTFSTKQVLDSNALGAVSVFAADLDGDNLLDVFAATGDELRWYKNIGNGSFDSYQAFGNDISATRRILSADLDNDGDEDVIAITDWPIYWLENLGNGQFGLSQELATLFYMDSGAVADTDGDGDQDIIGVSTYHVVWIENLGSGNFEEPVFIDEFKGGSDANFADIDGDGYEDLLVAKGSSAIINLYRNNGDGSFAPAEIVTAAVYQPTSVYGADLDADGDLDILSASLGDDKIAWYENLSTLTVNHHILTSQNDISIYPNPFQDVVILDGDFTNYQIEVFDSVGNLIQDYSNASSPLTIDLTALGSGIYSISVSHTTKPNLYVYKIIKE